MSQTYLDHAATSPLRPEAKAAMLVAMEIGANPSSIHGSGRKARQVVERARAQVAALAAADPAHLVFTSGGAEANALAIESAARHQEIGALYVGASEHDCVIEGARAIAKDHHLPFGVLPLMANGQVDLTALESELKSGARNPDRGGRAFVALMLANNETGVIHPIKAAAALVLAHGSWLHVDAVQAAGKIVVNMADLGADSLTLSSHKLGGPQGAGALLYGPRATLRRQIHGGGQERGLRAGTENVPGISGFGAAAECALSCLDLSLQQALWRDEAEQILGAAGAKIIGKDAPRLPHLLSLAVEDWSSELQVMALDLAGFAVSAGSACSSGKVKASRVLEAMGLSNLAGGVLRVSGGWSSTHMDWISFARAWILAHDRVVARRTGRAAE